MLHLLLLLLLRNKCWHGYDQPDVPAAVLLRGRLWKTVMTCCICCCCCRATGPDMGVPSLTFQPSCESCGEPQ
jgi:hypothetical protein